MYVSKIIIKGQSNENELVFTFSINNTIQTFSGFCQNCIQFRFTGLRLNYILLENLPFELRKHEINNLFVTVSQTVQICSRRLRIIK